MLINNFLIRSQKKPQFVLSVFCLIIINCFSIENVRAQQNEAGVELTDSTSFKSIQNQLVGCWRTKYSQFQYEKERNLGHEYRSRTHSSAPFFYLTILENNTYMYWVELTGGGSSMKVVNITKNRLIVRNENGLRVTYKRNKGCL
jgi:hypothetical protein